MRRALGLALVAGLCALLLVFVAGSQTTHAQAPGNTMITKPGGLLCPSNQFADVTPAATGEDAVFGTVMVEVPGSTPVRICGSNASNSGALNRSNAGVSCSPRCSDPSVCPSPFFEVEVRNGGKPRCIADATTNDAGVVTIVHTLR